MLCSPGLLIFIIFVVYSGITMKNITIICLFLFAFQADLFSQFQNVVVGTQDSPNEPSIMINPKNVNQVVAAANISVLFLFRRWRTDLAVGLPLLPYGVWGDPCIIVDTTGDYYFPAPFKSLQRILD